MRSCRKYNKNRNNNFLKAIKLKISCKQTFYVNSLIFAEKKIAVSQDPSEEAERCIYPHKQGRGSGVATAFDLGAFRLSMIVPVKKPVNHSRTVVSMHETGHERVERDFVFGECPQCKVKSLLVVSVSTTTIFTAVTWSLRHPFFSCGVVCAKNETSEH